MANYTKKGDKMPKGKPFVTGDPRAGRPKDPAELQQLKKLTKGELDLIFTRVLSAKPEDLNTFNGTVLEKWVAAIVFHGIKTGDFGRLTPFLDRLIGKVKEEVQGEFGFKIIIEDYTKKDD